LANQAGLWRYSGISEDALSYMTEKDKISLALDLIGKVIFGSIADEESS
jgi:hypothetical protein